jgi:hypothetical protein
MLFGGPRPNSVSQQATARAARHRTAQSTLHVVRHASITEDEPSASRNSVDVARRRNVHSLAFAHLMPAVADNARELPMCGRRQLPGRPRNDPFTHIPLSETTRTGGVSRRAYPHVHPADLAAAAATMPRARDGSPSTSRKAPRRGARHLSGVRQVEVNRTHRAPNTRGPRFGTPVRCGEGVRSDRTGVPKSIWPGRCPPTTGTLMP